MIRLRQFRLFALLCGFAAATSTSGCGKSSFRGASSKMKPDSKVESSPSEADSSGAKSGAGDSNPGTGDQSGLANPALKAVFANVPKDILGPESQVSILWEPDPNGGSVDGWNARVEVKPVGSDQWILAGDVPAEQKNLTFNWGNNPIGAFESRVTFVKGNLESDSGSAIWRPHIFSAAILTRSVKCLFCHIKVEGDVGGIDFPAEIHDASATGVRIIGELFSTSGIPEALKIGVPNGGPVASKGSFENYKNEGKKIFPKANNEGVTSFPQILAANLEGQMLGTLKSHPSSRGAAGIQIAKVHRGNLFIDGTDKPFELQGEVFIDGDLVIRGSYKGLGTLYARNIHIIGDVTASRSPYPFSGDEATALAQARTSLLRSDDALYLASLNQIWVGEYGTGMGQSPELGITPIDRSQLFQDFGGEARFLAVSQPPLPPSDYINLTPEHAPWTFKVPAKIRIDVARVDAFLFANDALVWHSHGNWLLNGGFVSPKAAMTSIIQTETGTWWKAHEDKNGSIGNCKGRYDAPDAVPDACGSKKAVLANPRNGLASHTNVIRFDYRLRAGGPGFESIRQLLDGASK